MADRMADLNPVDYTVTMFVASLDELPLRRTLAQRARKDRAARLFDGLLVPISSDAQELLEYIKLSFPSYTRHGLSHSLTIVERVGKILGESGRAQLSSIEIFSFILAALFHDSGMVQDGVEGGGETRMVHHQRSKTVVRKYFDERLPQLSEYKVRLSRCVEFVVEAHGLTWSEMQGRNEFYARETVGGQDIRPGVLAVLLRIGDLLDLDGDRSCAFNRSLMSRTLSAGSSSVHHDRHQHVESFSYTESMIRISVRPNSRTEHNLWTEWLGYLTQDIEKANTYLFTADLSKFRLPQPNINVEPADGARYVVWPLRFEIDNKGAIWNLVSRSVYTGRFDFIREVVNNAIDAELAEIWELQSEDRGVEASPRQWNARDKHLEVLVIYSESRGLLQVFDDGVGMDDAALQKFLFRVAESGMASKERLGQVFPAIAKFGIGFISVLSRANRVVVETRFRGDRRGVGRRVELVAGDREAFVEEVDLPQQGTRIMLWLRELYRGSEVAQYIQETYVYPSVAIRYIGLDALQSLLTQADTLRIGVSQAARTLGSLSGDEPGLAMATVRKVISEVEALQRDVHDERVRLDNLRRTDFFAETGRLGPAAPLPPRPLGAITIPRRGLPTLPFSVAVVSLGESLEPVRLIVDARPRDLAFGSSVVWVPVTFDDYTAGVEWRSLHGFLLRGRECVQSVVLYERASSEAEFDLEDWDEESEQIFRPESIPDLYDAVAEVSRRHVGRTRRDRTAGSSHVVRVSHDRIGLAQWVSISPGRMPKADAFEDVLDYEVIDEALHEQVGEDLPEDFVETDTRAWDEIRRARQQLRNEVFQDGLRLPISAAEIAPLGACRAVANLTAGARFDLNVTRASVDESPDRLRAWAAGTGLLIQSRVYASISSAFEQLGIRADPEKLLPMKRRRGVVSQYCRSVLQSLGQS